MVAAGSLHQNFTINVKKTEYDTLLDLVKITISVKKLHIWLVSLTIPPEKKVDYAVVYGEFMYQAASWPYERRVVCKVEKPEKQMTYLYTFIVTNMDLFPEYLIRFYCKRGLMENFIKESKSGFDFASVSSHTRIVNANRLQIHALAYNIFNWFKRLALSVNMCKQRIDTVHLKLLKIDAKAIHSA